MKTRDFSILVVLGILIGTALNTNQKVVIHHENLEESISHLIREQSPVISEKEIRILSRGIVRYSQDLKIPNSIRIGNQNPDPNIFLLALIHLKSGFDKNYAKDFTYGYMGIHDKVFKWYKDKSNLDLNQRGNIYEANYNLRAGILYLNDQFVNDLSLEQIIESYAPTPVRKSYKDKTNTEKFLEYYNQYYQKIRRP